MKNQSSDKTPMPRRENRKQNLKPKDYATSEVEVVETYRKGEKEGGRKVWKALILSTILIITIELFVILCVALFLFPELRLEILGILERVFGGLAKTV